MRKSYAGGLISASTHIEVFSSNITTWFFNPRDYCDCRIYWRDGKPDIIAKHAAEGYGSISFSRRASRTPDTGYFDLAVFQDSRKPVGSDCL